jgi:hypothetical protein
MASGLTLHVVAPDGHEGELMVAMLQQHGMPAEVCGDVLDLLDASREPLGPLLIAEESLSAAVLHRLGEVVHRQPTWSDLPVLIPHT